LNAVAQAHVMHGSEPAAVTEREPTGSGAGAGVGPSRPGLAEGLRLFLDLGVAQLDAAIRESDAQVGRLSEALSLLAAELRECGRGADPVVAASLELVGAHLQAAIRGLQFYDKLMQRLTHVRDGLAIPADAMAVGAAVGGAGTATDWQDVLTQVRARYSMVEERVLFDFMMRGLSTTEMLTALRSLRDAGSPGELEVF
jgi:hypothetical protein